MECPDTVPTVDQKSTALGNIISVPNQAADGCLKLVVSRELLDTRETINIIKCPVCNHEFQASNEIAKREAEVLAYKAMGYSNEDIAKCMFIGITTVCNYAYKARLKLNAKNITEAVAIAILRGHIVFEGE